MESKEDLMNQTLHSIKGMHRAVPSDKLYVQLWNRIQQQPSLSIYYTGKALIRIAAAIIIIIGLNAVSVLAVNKSKRVQVDEQTGIQNFATEYFQAQHKNILWY
ncbi:MAG: hypothetical protein ACK5UI_02310 [Bacteroidota bacterium]|jgi:hypothetical protein